MLDVSVSVKTEKSIKESEENELGLYHKGWLLHTAESTATLLTTRAAERRVTLAATCSFTLTMHNRAVLVDSG